MTDADRALIQLSHRCPDFLITEEQDGTFRATARYEVTALLAAAGCKKVLEAPSVMQLETQVAAQRMARSRVLASLWRQSPTPETQAYNSERLQEWLER